MFLEKANTYVVLQDMKSRNKAPKLHAFEKFQYPKVMLRSNTMI